MVHEGHIAPVIHAGLCSRASFSIQRTFRVTVLVYMFVPRIMADGVLFAKLGLVLLVFATSLFGWVDFTAPRARFFDWFWLRLRGPPCYCCRAPIDWAPDFSFGGHLQ
jgi:hypothetical protein